MAEKKAIIEERNLLMTAQIKNIKDAIIENILNEEQIRYMALAILENFQSVLVKNDDTMKFIALEDNFTLQEITVIRIENLLDVLKNKFRGESQIDAVAKDILLMLKGPTNSQRDAELHTIFQDDKVKPSSPEELALFAVELSRGYIDKETGADYLEGIIRSWVTDGGHACNSFPVLLLKSQVCHLLMESGKTDEARKYIDELKEVNWQFLEKFVNIYQNAKCLSARSNDGS